MPLATRVSLLCKTAIVAIAVIIMNIKTSYSNPNSETLNSRHIILNSIERIKVEDSTVQRAEEAYKLMVRVKELPPDVVDYKIIHELGVLLEDQNDSVRLWVAMSLKNIGPRAKQTIPALENALKRIECAHGSLTSEPAIRLALMKMGKNPPQRQCPTPE